MKFDLNTTVAALVKNFTTCRSALASFVRERIETRKRAIEKDGEFYRKLDAYCRANNLSPVCEDDWKTAAIRNNDDNRTTNQTKGHVSWTRKTNLPRPTA